MISLTVDQVQILLGVHVRAIAVILKNTIESACAEFGVDNRIPEFWAFLPEFDATRSQQLAFWRGAMAPEASEEEIAALDYSVFGKTAMECRVRVWHWKQGERVNSERFNTRLKWVKMHLPR